jgi:hypothetical protein
LPKPAILVLTLGIVLVYSHVTYRYLEIPLGKKMRRGLEALVSKPAPPLA